MGIYNKRSSKLNIFKMKPDEYLSISNSPGFFRKGTYTVKKSKLVDTTIYIVGTDKFGVDKRNMMVYDVKNTTDTNKNKTNKANAKTKINIWVSNDNGKYI